MTSMSLAALNESESLHICLFLEPPDACRLQVTNARGELQIKAASEELWSAFAGRRFSLVGKKIVPGPPRIAAELSQRMAAGPLERIVAAGNCNEQPSSLPWQRVFKLWAQAAHELGHGVECYGVRGEVPAEWIDLWRRLRCWLTVNAPHVFETIRRAGSAKEEHIEALEASGFSLAPAVLGMWRIFDGQIAPVDGGLAHDLRLPELPDGSSEEESCWANGLFGGYSVYDHEVSTILLPLRSALTLTQFLQGKIQPLYEQHRTKLAFACSHNYSKIMLVDAQDGQVYVWTRRPKPLLEPACPVVAAGKGLLQWVTEFTSRLETGCYVTCALRPESELSCGISLLPNIEPDFTRCVTNGVEVTASCAYMSEHPQGWTYRITFALVGDAASRGYDTCQLSVRHWEICTEGQEPQHVNGEGVIGFFPVLVDGGWLLNDESDPHGQYGAEPGFQKGPFSYQSCSGRSSSMRGTFGGDVTFVPGTIRIRTGQPFQARVEPFRLHVPDYIY